MGFPSKRSNVLRYYISFTRDSRLRVEAYVDNNDTTIVDEAYRQLHERAKEIEGQVGKELVWGDQKPNSRASRISLYFPHPIQVEDEDCWPEARKWAFKEMGKMRKAFDPLLQELELP